MLLGGPGAPAPLLKPTTLWEIWSPQTLRPLGPSPTFSTTHYNTHFDAYGLGWFVRDVRGYKEVSHSGALSGMLTEVTLVPELHLGLTNQRSSAAYLTVSRTIKDHYLGVSGVDWV
jgi:hypothetical protein